MNHSLAPPPARSRALAFTALLGVSVSAAIADTSPVQVTKTKKPAITVQYDRSEFDRMSAWSLDITHKSYTSH